jgi:adenosine deaminase
MMSIEETIESLPKVEQHVHIVGSVQPDTLLWLIKLSELDLQYNTLDDIKNFYKYSDFVHFLDIYSTVNDLITHEKHYETITYGMLQSQHRCNVIHVECIFSAYDHMRRGLSFRDMLFYINKAIRRAYREFGISCNIRIDLVRNYGPLIGMKVLDLIVSEGDNIVAIDTGGEELGFPPKSYVNVYRKAKEHGLGLVAHQGEGAGSEYVWECLEYLKPERIGHWVAAAEDPNLLKEISRRGISIETCPISNIKTGIVSELSRHPIRKFIEAGIKVSVNTDDPTMFGTDMNKEYLILYKALGFTTNELFKITLDSIETSFIPDIEKKRLIQVCRRAFEKL